uniref:Citrate transporter-like domain-containing protein n=1 Tax=Populus alba TaxID=43335 RepID=A0A4U5QAA7_POPAL|nr:hypothetical protein D5086_0000116200 [Populus alba]
MAMTPLVKLVGGTFALAIFWVLAVFPAVPLLSIGRTAGSNFGSSASPIGNPQNLVVAVNGQISSWTFLIETSPAALVGVLVIAILTLCMYWKKLSSHYRDEEYADGEIVADDDMSFYRFSPGTMSHFTCSSFQERSSSESDMFRVPSVMLEYAGNLKCMLKIENHIVEILCIPSNVTTGILSPTVASNLLPLDSAANMINLRDTNGEGGREEYVGGGELRVQPLKRAEGDPVEISRTFGVGIWMLGEGDPVEISRTFGVVRVIQWRFQGLSELCWARAIQWRFQEGDPVEISRTFGVGIWMLGITTNS